MKKFWGLLAAVGLLGTAAVGTRAVNASRDRSARQEALRSAEAAGQRAADALASHVAELKLKAQNATANPRLSAALQGNVDAATLQDLFRSEVWWQPYRDEFKVYAIALETDKLDILEGMNAADFAADQLVREARQRREPVAEIVMGKGWPYAAAATIAPVPERSIAPVLVLAKPIDEATLRRLADKAHGAVLLSDGKSAVLETGDGAERALLRHAVGAEGKGPIYLGGGREGSDGKSSDGVWAAAVSPLAPNLWMWTFGALPSAPDSAGGAATSTAAIWAAAALAAVAALFFAFRRSTPAGADGQFPSGQMSFGGAAAPSGATPGRSLAGGRSPPDPRRRDGATAGGGNSGTAVGPGVAETQVYEPTDGLAAAPDGERPITFGRYTLLDRLGAGGMAEVYTAVTFGAEGFRRTFVVKRLRAELAREPTVVAQFIDEANLGSTLVHSNIIPVFDFGKVGDEYFLAQEYILGRDLGRITARVIESSGKPLTYPVVLHVAHETLKALEYAHTKRGDAGRPLGIVHRDVSPNNVLVSARGEVKLFDFGIVKAEGRVTKTQHGVVKGNVSFMSPEQARGGEVDARADLFSMGLVIFYCLTGEVLYRGNTTYELLVRAATGPDTDELARIAALPGPCAEIVGRALRVDPAERYQTAGEFAAALLPYITGAAAEVLHLMRDLFTAELHQEETRFASVVPAGDRGGKAGASPTGTQAMISRRS
ncbi:MAG TPA: serine/threonine-protein kinase [Polyangia bacterium]|nr:serine/threonine-protein kinase [Polyangia bacterium]